MEKDSFYILSTSVLVAFTGAAVAIYTQDYLPASALAFASVGLFSFMSKNTDLTGRKNLKKTIISILDSFRELAILAPVMVLPMVPEALAVGVVTIYGIQKAFKASLESRMQKNFYPLISPDWRLLFLASMIGVAWYNSYIFYWGAWALLGIYSLEFLQLFRQLR